MKKNKSKKSNKNPYAHIREFWVISPITKIIPNKKKYNRNRDKKINIEENI